MADFNYGTRLIFIPASNTEIARLGIEPALIQKLVNGVYFTDIQK